MRKWLYIEARYEIMNETFKFSNLKRDFFIDELNIRISWMKIFPK